VGRDGYIGRIIYGYNIFQKILFDTEVNTELPKNENITGVYKYY
jgi:hypothetical protein